MRYTEIADALAERAESVCEHLLPAGKRKGKEWEVGDVSGSPGESLKVCLTGEKAGRWSDFAAGDSGDLFRLWAECRRLTNRETREEAMEFLGVSGYEDDVRLALRRYHPPEKPPAKKIGAAKDWLMETRCISAEAIDAYRLAQKPGERTIIFPCFDVSGKVMLFKYRTFPQKQSWCSADSRPTLFGWQALDGSERSIVLCEGELDALSWWDYGFPALSVPFGGGTGAKQAWIDYEFEALSGYDTIYIAMDPDSAGKAALPQIIDRLGRDRCRIVRLPRKDANQCAMDGIPRASIEAAVSASKVLDPSGLRRVSDYEQGIIDRHLGQHEESGIKTPWPKANSKLRLRSGEFIVVSGHSGHGKTQMLGNVVVDACHQGERVCMASLEDVPEQWIGNLAKQAAGCDEPTTHYLRECVKWLDERLVIYDGDADWRRIIETFSYVRRRHGVRFFCIDNLEALGVPDTDIDQQKELANACKEFVRTTATTLALVVHPRKQQHESDVYDKQSIKGSGAITNLAHTVLLHTRNKAKEKALSTERDEERRREIIRTQSDAVLIVDKQRNGIGALGHIHLWFSPQSRRFRDSFGAKLTEYVPYTPPAIEPTETHNDPTNF